MRKFVVKYYDKLGIERKETYEGRCLEKVRQKFIEEKPELKFNIISIEGEKHPKQPHYNTQGSKRFGLHSAKKLIKHVKNENYTKEIKIDKDSKEYKKYLKRIGSKK